MLELLYTTTVELSLDFFDFFFIAKTYFCIEHSSGDGGDEQSLKREQQLLFPNGRPTTDHDRARFKVLTDQIRQVQRRGGCIGSDENGKN